MDYIQYAYYDEVGKRVAIIDRATPQNKIEEYKSKYDEVKYEE